MSDLAATLSRFQSAIVAFTHHPNAENCGAVEMARAAILAALAAAREAGRVEGREWREAAMGLARAVDDKCGGDLPKAVSDALDVVWKLDDAAKGPPPPGGEGEGS